MRRLCGRWSRPKPFICTFPRPLMAVNFSRSLTTEWQKPPPSMTVKQVLAGRPPNIFTLSGSSSIKQAMNHLVTKKLSSCLVLNDKEEIIGMVTARDVLRFVNDLCATTHISARSLRGSADSDALLSNKVTQVMTPVGKMVYCSPKDTVTHCREIMFQLKIRHMPVLNDHTVEGIVTLSDLSDAEFNDFNHGGKKGYISNVMGRKGLPSGTHVVDGSLSSIGQRTSYQDLSANMSNLHIGQPHASQPCVVRTGSYTLPHPFKMSSSVAGSQRQYGGQELCKDNTLNEDAHFVATVQFPGPHSDVVSSFSSRGSEGMVEQVYACVADGVGSWRQYGVDPRMYSHRLVDNLQTVIRSDASRIYEDYLMLQTSRRNERGENVSAIGKGEMDNNYVVHPLDALCEAWHMTNQDQDIIGSTTVCVATIDAGTSHLSYSNVGDGGLMVVRHIPRHGTLNMGGSAIMDKDINDNYKIAYLAQQQLRSFNFPCQLGNGGRDYDGFFEQPLDADTASIPLMPRDIVVLATDGLFDNLSISEIITIISEWEQNPEKDEFAISDDEKNKSMENNSSYEASLQVLAKKLVLAAREASLSKEKDSPFALLAKENDIMWGGGMPDDTTVVIMKLDA